MSDAWQAAATLAVFVATAIEAAKQAAPAIDGGAARVLKLVLGIAAALLFAVDVPAALGLSSPVPHVGEVVTGFVIGGASGGVYDVAKLVTRAADLLKNGGAPEGGEADGGDVGG